MKKKFKKQLRVSRVLMPFVLGVGITVLAVMIQPNSFLNMGYRFLAQPTLFLLNFLPIFLLVVCFGALFHSAFLGGALTNIIICCLSLASRIKVNTRDEPLMPRDFLMLKEVGEALNSYDIDFPVLLMILVLLVTAVLIYLGIREKRLRPGNGHWGLRLLTGAAAMAALVILTMTLFASDDIYYSFQCTNSYYIARTYNEYGMPYSFFHNFTANPVDCPEGYDSEEAQAWDDGVENTDGAPVHLIMVMNEAFTDLPDCEVFDYSEEDDPISFFHSLQKDAHCISGRVVVPNLGGGTSNTEFDVMTGMQTDSISVATSTAFDVVTQDLDSIFRVYNAAGYATEYIHPGYTWFYNRQNVLARMGARSTLFYEAMEDKEMKGTWVTDDYVADLVIESFENAVAAGEMLYNYTTTVQNHMAYTDDKYGEGYVFSEVPATMELSEDAQEVLSVYFEGLRDADSMLEKLVGYFASREEPVVLVFWGDHYPNLGNGLTYYNELGLTDNLEYWFKYYATPYVIWANDAAAQTLAWEDTVSALDLPENGYLSSCYLGAAVLELCGRGDATPWYTFINQLRRELPVVWYNACYFDNAGNLLYELDDEQTTLISQWRCWSYYKLMEKKVLE